MTLPFWHWWTVNTVALLHAPGTVVLVLASLTKHNAILYGQSSTAFALGFLKTRHVERSFAVLFVHIWSGVAMAHRRYKE
jgi:hypothetical protein